MARGGKDGGDTTSGGGGGKKGGGGGGTPTGDLTLVGTLGDDTLKGGSGNDTLTGLSGDDFFDGGDGTDSVILSGDFAGYEITYGKRNSIIVTDIDPSDGDDGVSTLRNIEWIEFANYSWSTTTTNRAPVVTWTDAITVYEHQTVTYTFSVQSLTDETATGYLWGNNTGLVGDRIGVVSSPDGLFREYTYEINGGVTGVEWWGRSPAEGEIVEYQIELRAGTLYWGYGVRETINVTVVGVNDDPTMADGTLTAVEDGGPVSTDLAPLGADIDTDDDGSTLSYRLTGVPAGVTAWIDGTTLWFDPLDSFQELQRTDSTTLILTVEAVDSHGGVSNTAEIVVTVNGANDPLPDYLNADGSIDYAALGISTAVPWREAIDGFAPDPWLLDFVDGTTADDVRVARAEKILSLDDNTFFDFPDTTVYLGDGDDVLALLLDGDQASLGGFSGVDVSMGSGNDVVVLDGTGVTDSFYINVTDIRTGDGQDQVLVDLDTEANGWIDDFRYGLRIDTGNDNDLVSIVRQDSNGGENSQFMGSIDLGSDDDIFEFEWSVGSTKNGFVDMSFSAGYGNDIARIDTSGTTGDGSADAKTGLYGSISMGPGDDILYLNLADPVEDDAYAWITGSSRDHAVLHLEMGGVADFEVTQIPNTAQYEVEWNGQTLRLSGWEQVWANDGLLLGDSLV